MTDEKKAEEKKPEKKIPDPKYSVRMKQQYSGPRVILDRYKDEDGNMVDQRHLLPSKEYSAKKVQKVVGKIMKKDKDDKENYVGDKLKMELILGKPFKVHDLDYVLEKHGAILQKA